MTEKAREIAIAVEAWIEEIDALDLEPEQIQASFTDFCRSFDFPEDVARRAVARALEAIPTKG